MYSGRALRNDEGDSSTEALFDFPFCVIGGMA
jgi:hypothetical protein